MSARSYALTAAEPSLDELQAAVDAASGAWGRGMSGLENGDISPAEFGQLKRRMMRAEKALQEAKLREAH